MSHSVTGLPVLDARSRLDIDGSERSSKIILTAQNWIFGTSRIRSLLSEQTSAVARRHLRQVVGPEPSAWIGGCLFSQVGSADETRVG